jgi:hypothetical protein
MLNSQLINSLMIDWDKIDRRSYLRNISAISGISHIALVNDFYVNRFGFHIVEFFNSHHPDPNDPDSSEEFDAQFPDGMFWFDKVMR